MNKVNMGEFGKVRRIQGNNALVVFISQDSAVVLEPGTTVHAVGEVITRLPFSPDGARCIPVELFWRRPFK